jgi:hypothetical protein
MFVCIARVFTRVSFRCCGSGTKVQAPAGLPDLDWSSPNSCNLLPSFELFAALQAKTQARTGHSYRTVVIQEAGLDGFWIHRALEKEGIESHVVDPASITTSRRKKRAKTDRIDGEALVRALLAYKRGEPVNGMPLSDPYLLWERTPVPGRRPSKALGQDGQRRHPYGVATE